MLENEPPKSKSERTKKFDVEEHEEHIRMAEVVTEGIRALQRLVGNRRPLYHTLQKYLDCMKYVKQTGIERLPYWGTRVPLSVEQTRDHCIMSVVAYLITEYWEYQQSEVNVTNIDLIHVYIDCLCQIPYKQMQVEGTSVTGYYVWADPTTKLDKS